MIKISLEKIIIDVLKESLAFKDVIFESEINTIAEQILERYNSEMKMLARDISERYADGCNVSDNNNNNIVGGEKKDGLVSSDVDIFDLL